MNFKRIVAFALILVMALSAFAACGPETAPEESTGSENTSAPEISGNETQASPDETTGDETTGEIPGDETTGEKVEYPTITIAEALALCEQFVDAASTDRYYIRGIIKEMQNETYGQMVIEDSTGSILVYGTYSADGSIRYDAMTSKPVVGDEVLLYGTLQNYKGNTKEIQNARLIDFYTPEGASKPEDQITVKRGVTITIAEAQAIAGKVDISNRYIIEATVDSVTNANFGAMLIKDATGSISVYNSKNADGTVDYANMTDKPVKGDTVKLYCTVQNFNGTFEIKSAYIVEFKHNTVDESA